MLSAEKERVGSFQLAVGSDERSLPLVGMTAGGGYSSECRVLSTQIVEVNSVEKREFDVQGHG